jgi:hypothetical protein
MSGRYYGQPMPVHLPLPIDTPHFDRWLEILAATAREVCPPAAATDYPEHGFIAEAKLGALTVHDSKSQPVSRDKGCPLIFCGARCQRRFAPRRLRLRLRDPLIPTAKESPTLDRLCNRYRDHALPSGIIVPDLFEHIA